MSATSILTLAPSLRFEWKFIPHGLNLAEVLAMVGRHPALFRETYPARTVNNIYLDSAGLHDYFEHLHGSARRSKTRLRWYGPFEGYQRNLHLERKAKSGQVSTKAAWTVPELRLNGRVTGQTLEPAFARAGLPDQLRSSLGQVEPSLLNRYRRHYFQSANGRFRLTVDSSLEFTEPRQTGRWRGCAGLPDLAVILELKFGIQQADEAATLTNAFPFRLTRCSKYVLGIQTLTHLMR